MVLLATPMGRFQRPVQTGMKGKRFCRGRRKGVGEGGKGKKMLGGLLKCRGEVEGDLFRFFFALVNYSSTLMGGGAVVDRIIGNE